MDVLEKPRAKRVAREVDVWRSAEEMRRQWCRRRQRGWRRRREKRREKRHNVVNKGSCDYALRVAANRDETGIRVVPRKDDKSTSVEKGSILKGRTYLDGTALSEFLRQERGRGTRLKHAETGNLLNNGPILGAKGSSEDPETQSPPKLVWIDPSLAWSLSLIQEASPT